MEQILEDVRVLIRENILPRITDLEVQLSELRRETWPVTQYVTERHLLDHPDNTRQRRQKFLRSIDDNEADYLRRRLKIFNVY
jgi:hypothetical protein